MKRAVVCALIGLAAAGCDVFTRADDDPALCPQTYEFGNYGCARVIAIVDGTVVPPLQSFILDVRLRSARANAEWSGAMASAAERVPLTVDMTLYVPLRPAGVDTLSVWVVGRVLDNPLPPRIGVPLASVAVDSTLHLLRFAPVGSRRVVDTVRLTLHPL